jgi:hypothetical protein
MMDFHEVTLYDGYRTICRIKRLKNRIYFLTQPKYRLPSHQSRLFSGNRPVIPLKGPAGAGLGDMVLGIISCVPSKGLHGLAGRNPARVKAGGEGGLWKRGVIQMKKYQGGFRWEKVGRRGTNDHPLQVAKK